MDLHQTREHAGFRNGFSTIDRIQPVNQLTVKADEHNFPLRIAFVDHEKACDTITFNPMFAALENQGVESAYIDILIIYSN